VLAEGILDDPGTSNVLQNRGTAPPNQMAYQYNVLEHDSGECRGLACEPEGNLVVTKLVCYAGAGDEMDDNKSVTVRFNTWMYIGANVAVAQYPTSMEATFHLDGEDVPIIDEWAGPGTTTTTNSISYKWGTWQGAADAWTVTTTTPAL